MSFVSVPFAAARRPGADGDPGTMGRSLSGCLGRSLARGFRIVMAVRPPTPRAQAVDPFAPIGNLLYSLRALLYGHRWPGRLPLEAMR